jgi:hypothetical protein
LGVLLPVRISKVMDVFTAYCLVMVESLLRKVFLTLFGETEDDRRHVSNGREGKTWKRRTERQTRHGFRGMISRQKRVLGQRHPRYSPFTLH